jgi:hypothetical protein
MAIIAIRQASLPAGWRRADALLASEYEWLPEWGDPPTDEYLWDAGLGRHRLPSEMEAFAAANAALWSAQAAARKDREAKAALALPDSDDPVILRRKLNAALYLIQR